MYSYSPALRRTPPTRQAVRSSSWEGGAVKRQKMTFQLHDCNIRSIFHRNNPNGAQTFSENNCSDHCYPIPHCKKVSYNSFGKWSIRRLPLLCLSVQFACFKRLFVHGLCCCTVCHSVLKWYERRTCKQCGIEHSLPHGCLFAISASQKTTEKHDQTRN